MVSLTLLILTALSGPSSTISQDVSSYWDALQKGEKQKAVRWVAADSVGHFHQRREPLFRNWRLREIERVSAGKARVTVSMERWIGDGWFTWTMQEQWVKTESGWRVRVRDGSQARKALFRKSGSVSAESGRLRVVPDTVRFHRLSRSAPRTILVANGSGHAAVIDQLSFDPSLFALEAPRQPLEPGENGRIVIRYKGPDEDRPITARVAFRVTYGGHSEDFEIRVVCNHVSPAGKALTGDSGRRSKGAKTGSKKDSGNGSF